MDNIDIKRDVRYLIATFDDQPYFLAWNAKRRTYSLVTDVSRATKCVGTTAAKWVLEQYKQDTKDLRLFTILPLYITYSFRE